MFGANAFGWPSFGQITLQIEELVVLYRPLRTVLGSGLRNV